MKSFVRRYVHSLEEYEIILSSNARQQTLSAAESKWAVFYPDAAHWVSTATVTGGKKAATRSWASLQPLQPRKGLKDLEYLFTFPNVSKGGIFIIIFI
jgi:hypothetical protein